MSLFSDHWNNDDFARSPCSGCYAAQRDFNVQYCALCTAAGTPNQSAADREIRRIAYEQLKKEFEGQ